MFDSNVFLDKGLLHSIEQLYNQLAYCIYTAFEQPYRFIHFNESCLSWDHLSPFAEDATPFSIYRGCKYTHSLAATLPAK